MTNVGGRWRTLIAWFIRNIAMTGGVHSLLETADTAFVEQDQPQNPGDTSKDVRLMGYQPETKRTRGARCRPP
jgi:hypothetical protein